MLAGLCSVFLRNLGVLVGRLVVARPVRFGGFDMALGSLRQMLARLFMVLLCSLLVG